MNVITTFTEKREAKIIAFERKVLRELSLKKLKEKVAVCFSPFFRSQSIFSTAIEDGSIDVAIEVFILGAKMSRFGYMGENEDEVRARCTKDLKYYIDSLYEYLLYWGAASGSDLISESVYIASEQFVLNWWKEGFKKGEMRYKMRLH